MDLIGCVIFRGGHVLAKSGIGPKRGDYCRQRKEERKKESKKIQPESVFTGSHTENTPRQALRINVSWR